MTDPIAAYKEARFYGKRTFELFEDTVVVRGKHTFKSEFEIAVPLRILVPSVVRTRARNKAFFSGLWLTIGSLMVAYIVESISQKDASEAIIYLCILSGVGVLLSVVTARKVEWAQFISDAGIIALNVARAGKQTDKFDSFVEALVAQIRMAKGES
jgi:hypothetical protein